MGPCALLREPHPPKVNEKLSVGVKSICVLYLYLEIEFVKPLALASGYRSGLTTVAAEPD